MTRAEAIAIANVALRAIARGLWRAAVYLGPLLVAALDYLAKLVADAVSAVRTLILRRARAKTPSQSSEYEQREAALREAKGIRWTAWLALPPERQFAVRVAAVAILVVFAVIVRARFTTSAETEPTAESSLAFPAALADVAATQPPPSPPIDTDTAAARFQRDARAKASGQWTFLTEGPVLTPGARGEFDDFIVASPSVLRDVERGAA